MEDQWEVKWEKSGKGVGKSGKGSLRSVGKSVGRSVGRYAGKDFEHSEKVSRKKSGQFIGKISDFVNWKVIQGDLKGIVRQI